MAHLEANGQKTGEDYDWYYGNLAQFELRHERLKQKLKEGKSKILEVSKEV